VSEVTQVARLVEGQFSTAINMAGSRPALLTLERGAAVRLLLSTGAPNAACALLRSEYETAHRDAWAPIRRYNFLFAALRRSARAPTRAVKYDHCTLPDSPRPVRQSDGSGVLHRGPSPKAAPMNIQKRNNVQIQGGGSTTMIFAHGFGCDQNMWRFMAPRFAEKYRVVTFDLVGSGASDLAAYDASKYASLDGYADDLLEIAGNFAKGPILFVGHSVSGMVGMLADLKAPGTFAAHLMIGPSPCYVNDGDYIGGFERDDIDSLLDALESNYLGWASSMAPAIMGVRERPEFGEELTASFCRTDPEIAKQFARATFLSDNRKELPRLKTPTLIVQSSEDLIAPVVVGEYMHKALSDSMLRIVANTGHCPHLSAPGPTCDAIEEFLALQAGL
jgi:sigma-B regulation protein RsbQ